MCSFIALTLLVGSFDPLKTRPRYDLQCVWRDVKPYSINQSIKSNLFARNKLHKNKNQLMMIMTMTTGSEGNVPGGTTPPIGGKVRMLNVNRPEIALRMCVHSSISPPLLQPRLTVLIEQSAGRMEIKAVEHWNAVNKPLQHSDFRLGVGTAAARSNVALCYTIFTFGVRHDTLRYASKADRLPA